MEWVAPLLGIPLGSLLDHLPQNVTLWVDEPDAVERELANAAAEVERLEPEARARAPHLPPRESLFDSPDRILRRVASLPRVESALATPCAPALAGVSLDALPSLPSAKADLLRTS